MGLGQATHSASFAAEDERQRIEEVLVQSESRLREAQRIANVGSWELDLGTDTLTWSDQIFRIFEIDPTQFGASYEAFLALVHPDDRAQVNVAYTRSVETRTPYEIEHRLRMPDGRVKHVRERGETFYGPSGEALRTIGTVQDITAQKISEQRVAAQLEEKEALLRELHERERELAEAVARARESELRFQVVFESSPDAMLVVGRDGSIQLANDAAERLFGYTRAELLGMRVEALVPEDYRAEHAHLRAGFMDSPWPRIMGAGRELRGRTKSGHEVPVEIGLSQATISGQQAVLVAVRDVSERARAAAELAAQRELLRRVVDTNPSRIFIKDPEGRYTFANRATAEALGTTVEALLGRCDTDFALPAGELAARTAMDREVTEYGRTVVWPAHSIANVTTGVLGFYQVAKVPLVIDGRTHVLGIVTDVTEIERTKQELHKVSSDLGAMLRAFPDLLFRLDDEGRILDYRAGRAELYVPPEQFLGVRMAEVLPPDVAMRVDVARREAIATGTVSQIEYDLPMGERVQSYEGRFVPSSEGEALLIVRNVTEQKQMREALAQRNEQLQSAQKLEAIGRLAGGIAHDFNNVLTVILGLSKVLERMLAEQAKPLALVRDIHEAGQRASGVVSQLLAFARRKPSRARTIDLNEHLTSFRRLLEPALGERVTLELELAEEDCLVRLDPAHLEQVILNLAVNARDAMEQGGRVAMRTRLARRPSSADAELGVLLEVQDDGHGMSDDVKARAFEPFFTTKPFGTGTGLGLSTVYGIVAQAGGEVSLESSVGVGTTFRVWWPRATRRRASPEARIAVAVQVGAEKVLVVEDDDAVRNVTVRALASAGYEVLEAKRPSLALAIAKQVSHLDLVVTDVVMPDMDGPTFVKELWRANARMPVLFVTGHPGNAGLIEGAPLLLKPFDPDLLLSMVRKVLDDASGRGDV